MSLHPGAATSPTVDIPPDPRHDPRSRLERRLNHLKEFALDRHQRLLLQSARSRMPEVRAALDLRAAEWAANCDELHGLLIELRGAPEEGSGAGAAVSGASIHEPPPPGASDAWLLDESVADEDRAVQDYREVLADASLPFTMRATLARQRRTAIDSALRFSTMRRRLTGAN
jgi:hypothetical protein